MRDGLGVHDDLQLLRGVDEVCQLPGLVGEGLPLGPHAAHVVEWAELGGLLGLTTACKAMHCLVINAHCYDRIYREPSLSKLRWTSSQVPARETVDVWMAWHPRPAVGMSL